MNRLVALTVAAMTAVAAFGAAPTDGLVAYYPFDGDANDASGNGNHGFMNGTRLTADRKGRLGCAMLFGRDNFISVPNSPSLNSPSDQITLAAWVRVGQWFNKDNKVNTLVPLLCKGNVQYRFQLSRNSERCFLFDGESYAECQCTPLRGEWHHIAASYDGTTFRAYVDGVMVGERAHQKSNTITTSNSSLFIGWDPPLSYWFLGAMDELRIYNRALSGDEIHSLYEADETTQTQVETKGWHVAVADSKTRMGYSLAAAQKTLRDNPSVEQDYAVCALAFDFKHGIDEGDFPEQRGVFPGRVDSGNQYFATRVRGKIRIPSAGDWTFAVRSDDGFRLTITGAGFIAVLQRPTFVRDTELFPLSLPDSGQYDVELIHWNDAGDANLEFSAAKGELEAFDVSAFRLVGDPEGEIGMIAEKEGVDAWLEENGLAGAWDEKDANGIANVFRYVFDMPTETFADPPLIDITLEDGRVVVKTPDVANTAGVAVSVVESSDVGGTADVVGHTLEEAAAGLEMSGGSRFYRLAATMTE